MTRLAITVPLMEGETPVSFASRLARANGRDRVRDFALDVGLDFAGVVRGDPPAIAQLAHLGNCSFERLAAWTVVIGKSHSDLRGQRFTRHVLRRNSVFVCPRCLMDDMSLDGIDPEVRAWGRAIWQVSGIRTCPVHERSLVEITRSDTPHTLHDFNALTLPHLAGLHAFDRQTNARSLSSLESHVIDRLVNGVTGAALHEALPLHALIRLSENLGAVLLIGPRVVFDTLNEDALHEVGSVGYDVLAAGEAGVRSALDRLQEPFASGRGSWGPGAIFGRLYEWLANENDDPDFDPIREIMERHMIETMPFGPGDMIFGHEVKVRRVHSLHSASLEFGLHPTRLRTVLRDAGRIGVADIEKTSDRILFPAEVIERELALIKDSISLAEAGRYINAPRTHERLLFKAGFITSFVRGGAASVRKHGILRRDLDRFLERLTEKARPGVSRLSNIPTAARHARCSAMEVVELLLDGRLERVGRDDDARGYLSVLVDPEEVKPHVRLQEHGGISLREVERRMKWSTAVVVALTGQGLLESSIAINPVNRCPQRIVTEGDLRKFDEAYVSLLTFASERGIHFSRARRFLMSAGIEPDLGFASVPATFYRRADLGKLPPT